MLVLKSIPYGDRDITQDFPLLDYLYTRELPVDMSKEEKARILKRS